MRCGARAVSPSPQGTGELAEFAEQKGMDMTRIIAPLGVALLLGLAPLAAPQAQTQRPAAQPVPDAASHTPAATQGSATKGTPSAAVQGREVAKVVNINSASKGDLLSLPDVGKSRAQAIIQHRPYSDTNELVSRGIMPKSEYDQINDRITTK